MARYEFKIDGNTVTCTSHYATKPYTGIAKCHPDDTFDEEIGKILAKFRCDLKIEEKRSLYKSLEIKDIDRQIAALMLKKEKCIKEFNNSRNDNYDILFNYVKFLGKIQPLCNDDVDIVMDTAEYCIDNKNKRQYSADLADELERQFRKYNGEDPDPEDF